MGTTRSCEDGQSQGTGDGISSSQNIDEVPDPDEDDLEDLDGMRS